MNGLIKISDLGPIWILVIVDLLFKGIALYKSSRRNQRVWFVALLLVNSLGILPLIYLFVNNDVNFGWLISFPKKLSKNMARKCQQKERV